MTSVRILFVCWVRLRYSRGHPGHPHPRTFSGSKDVERPVPPCHCRGDVKAKQILLSYVRAEASQYALQLKEELMHLGFSVYLVSH